MNSVTEVTELPVTQGTGYVAIFLVILFYLACAAVSIFLLILIIKALMKYIRSKPIREEKQTAIISLSQALKEQRTKNKMTQEFVAEALGVSRQAVSKWENGTSDPSTSNLIALAKLYKVSAAELLNASETNNDQ